MRIFNINYDSLVPQNMPVDERTTFNVSWLRVLIDPVKYLYGLFMAFLNSILYDLNHNGQVCKMEGALNDVFDATLRRIYISDPVYDDPIFIYQDDELKLVWIYQDAENKPLWLYRDNEVYAVGGVQWVVNVPAGLGYDANRMKALINKYRLASKGNYVIVTF